MSKTRHLPRLWDMGDNILSFLKVLYKYIIT